MSRLGARGWMRWVNRLVWGLGGLLMATAAHAWQQDLRIQVAESRQHQCGAGWDPQQSGRWGNPRGHIAVDGERIHAFDLSDPAECEGVVQHSVHASEGQRIVVRIETGNGPMDAVLTAPAADRVWRVQYFTDQAWGEVLSTDWPEAGESETDSSAASPPDSSPADGLHMRPGQRWQVIETYGAQRWYAQWVVRPDGRSFDATWRHEPGGETGTLQGFAWVASMQDGEVVIERPGLGHYQGLRSADGRRIEGRTTWCDCRWSVELRD